MIKKLIVPLVVLLLTTSVIRATVITINPTDARGIRDFHNGDGPFLLNSLLIKKGTEDRSVLEFDVSGLSESIPLVTLDLSFGNLDYPEPPDGIIDVFTYIGDGIITADEFYVGGSTPFTSFVGENGPEYGFVSIDVTSVIQDILAADEQFIGFRLSTETSDRFDIGQAIGVPDPVLTAVPEPATVLLLALGGLFLRRRRPK